MGKQTDRFEKIYSQGTAFSGIAEVLADRTTGVHYLFVKSGYGGGLCPLLDRDGKPIVAEPPQENG